MKILVTGATGFVGRALVAELEKLNFPVVATSRRTLSDQSSLINMGEISPSTDWSSVLEGCETVVHTAGRAHILDDKAKDKLAEFRRVNRDATLKLAHDAEQAGVQHFIFISSIGVNGNCTHDLPFTEASEPRPVSDYAVSKYEAELALTAQFDSSKMRITIVRPALICGENAPGNIRRLLKLVASGIPLPFKGVNNKRGMASLENVVSFIIACVTNHKSKGELFLLADLNSPSTEDIINAFATGMNKPARIFRFPSFLLEIAMKITGKKNLYDQLYGSLDIDSNKASELLTWKHPTTILNTMKKTASYFSKEIK